MCCFAAALWFAGPRAATLVWYIFAALRQQRA